MSSLLKDIAVLLFSAGEEIERMADEFRRKRNERYAEFEASAGERTEGSRASADDETGTAAERIGRIAEKVGLASKTEIEEIKKRIDELSAKIDKLAR